MPDDIENDAGADMEPKRAPTAHVPTAHVPTAHVPTTRAPMARAPSQREYDGVLDTIEAGIGEPGFAKPGGWQPGYVGGAGTGTDAGYGAQGGEASARGSDSWGLMRVAAIAITLLAAAAFGWLALRGYIQPVSASLSFGRGERDPASVQRLQQVWDALNNDFYQPVDQDRMIEEAAAAMAASVGDVYTTYYTKDEMARFTERTSGHYTGIGVYVAEDEDGDLVVTGMFDGSAAAEAGVLVGDRFVSVDGVGVGEIADNEEVVSRIRGEAGTIVSLRFYRPSISDYVEFDITRRDVKMQNIEAAMIHIGASAPSASVGGDGAGEASGSEGAAGGDGGSEAGDGSDGAGEANGSEAASDSEGVSNDDGGDALPPGIKEIWDPGFEGMIGEIGYIRLLMFDGDAAKDFESYLEKLAAAGAEGLVIDLRDNPGGNFEECLRIASHLIGDGVIVTVESRSGRTSRSSTETKTDMPFKILINENSASASEIVAGAVKDHGTGKLIGTRTFGKGLVQLVIPLAGGAGLKYTQSRYFTPNGESIHEIGIEPDIAVTLPGTYADMPTAAIPYAEDMQLKAALTDFFDDFARTASIADAR